ncbi:non-heme iron oxygenase ferredoxin subunit [Serinibacter salmoneus]|uniref:3-phenylpropionate/trans-cinnamate dioxygenase ferredoxin subunit n=1 Tax=Serinibacter salmoneus TaxID=556530 RepID=A0A2A9CZN8_9MICO|nr:non-heme iron oxygenase ferredoxin subunit [Serinibacter salmoneus]PFG19465.1 3-phenylpropionate/trans-cinnamate dioxygenase ferredoxin subunit [Serinibacter salmoneus]
MTAQSAAFLDELEPGTAMSVSVTAPDGSDMIIALVRTADGSVYALDDECSHGRASLGEGDVEGNGVECWKHGSIFDVTTGRPMNLPATKPVATYPVTIEGELVLVDVDGPAN